MLNILMEMTKIICVSDLTCGLWVENSVFIRYNVLTKRTDAVQSMEVNCLFKFCTSQENQRK